LLGNVLWKIKTHILIYEILFRNWCRLWGNVDIFGRAGKDGTVWCFLLINYVCLLGTEELYILTLLGSGHHNNHEICQCRMYSRKILLMGKEFVRNM